MLNCHLCDREYINGYKGYCSKNCFVYDQINEEMNEFAQRYEKDQFAGNAENINTIFELFKNFSKDLFDLKQNEKTFTVPVKMGLYQEAISKWNNKQVIMIQEESAELLIEIGKLQKIIAKLIRNSVNGFIESQILQENPDFQSLEFNLADEVADFIIMLDQFYQADFGSLLNNRLDYKLERLAKFILGEKE